MRKPLKTILLSGAFLALTAHTASAQPILARVQCQAQGGKLVDGKCELPAKPEAAPPAAGPRAGGQPAAQPNGRGQAQGQPGAAPGAVQQGNGQPQGGRGPGGQQGGQPGGQQAVQPPAPQQAGQNNGRGNNGNNNDRGNNNFGRDNNNDRNNNGNNNFGRDNNDRNNNNFGRDNNNDRNNNNFGNNNFGRDNNQFGNNRNYNGRNFDQAQFDRRYYGRYGSDPNNFNRDRLRYRAQAQWRERYPHDYVYADDSFYRDCRNNNEVGGAIIGAILGGILGNAASNGQGGATLAGMILGGAGGAAIASNLDCQDRTYVYRTYYDGFERGRRNTSYQWRNDQTGHYGTLLVGDYYQDRDNYRCATYSQTIYVRGTPQLARGHACRQEDGTWAIVD